MRQGELPHGELPPGTPLPTRCAARSAAQALRPTPLLPRQVHYASSPHSHLLPQGLILRQLLLLPGIGLPLRPLSPHSLLPFGGHACAGPLHEWLGENFPLSFERPALGHSTQGAKPCSAGKLREAPPKRSRGFYLKN